MGKRKRKVRRRRLLWVAVVGPVIVGGVVLAAVPSRVGETGRVVSPARHGLSTAAMVTPTRVAKPVHLETTYVAPPAPPGRALGRLRLDRLGLDAAITEVGWDGDTMAVPNDPKVLGWLGSSAQLEDRAGTSLIASHVSDPRGHPGSLARLTEAKVGDAVIWQGINGRKMRFRVTSIERFPRSAGLPTRLFAVDGPHVLRLVTCTHNVARSSGFHYTDNLVVSAVATGT